MRRGRSLGLRTAARAAASLNLADLAQLIHGVARLPNGRDAVCGATAFWVDGQPDWLVFYLPLEALERTDRRIDGYPAGDDCGTSLEWRHPIDDWLADIAIRAYAEVSFQAAAIGFEASAFDVPDKVAAEQGDARVLPLNGVPHYLVQNERGWLSLG
jgi:hypothetical protein